jgi:hypothetical protein
MNVCSSARYRTFSAEAAGRLPRDPQSPSYRLNFAVFTPGSSGISSLQFSHFDLSFLCSELCFCAVFLVPVGEPPDPYRYVSFRFANFAEQVAFIGTHFPTSVLCWGLGGGSDQPTHFRYALKRRLTSRDHLVFSFAFPDTRLWSDDVCMYGFNVCLRYTL